MIALSLQRVRENEMSEPHDTELLARLLGEVVPDALIIHDTTGQIIDVNDAMCRMSGYDRDELLRLNVADVETNIEPGAFWNEMSADQVFTVEGRHLRKNGSTYPVEVKVAAFMSGDDKVICALCRDVTERKLREEELRGLAGELADARDEAVAANEAKSSFLANVSHELRTPLHAIIGYSEMLRGELEDAGLSQHAGDLERIQTASKQLMELINDLLDLSKIEAGGMDVSLQNFAPEEFCRQVEAMVRPLADKNGNRFSVTCEVAPGTVIKSDPRKLRQILLNLSGNACKFTSGGDVSLRIEPQVRNGIEGVLWSVTDTGIGMTAEQLSRIFDSYAQADASTRGEFGGTGLGLAISRRFAQLLGGEIEVQSTPGEGSTFSVWIPADARVAS